jgi:hypothetical protein
MLDPRFLAIVPIAFACVLTNDIIQEDELFISESETLLVDSLLLYAKTIEAVKLLATLAASSSTVISILGDIKSEARL